jgi:hypothetical protein
MIRRSDWDIRLSSYLAERMNDALFIWGQSDCALYVADGILEMTGEDIAAPFRGQYATAAGSVKALRRYGAGTLQATFDSLLSVRPIAFARRGDVVMHDGAVGFCVGAEARFMRAEGKGLEPIPRALWQAAWSVGA